MTRVLGLDLSIASTGVAHVNGDVDTIRTVKSDGEYRLVRIGDAVTAIVEADRPDLVVIEDYVVQSHASSALGMVHGVVRRDLLAAGVPYLLVAPSTLKVYATGRGNAKKPDMRVELLKRTGLDLADDNQCDAWWLHALGHALAGAPVLDLPKDHVRALAKLTFPAAVAA